MLHIVSMDIVIDAKYGDARNEGTRDYWLGAIRDRKVVALWRDRLARPGRPPENISLTMAIKGHAQSEAQMNFGDSLACSCENSAKCALGTSS